MGGGASGGSTSGGANNAGAMDFYNPSYNYGSPSVSPFQVGGTALQKFGQGVGSGQTAIPQVSGFQGPDPSLLQTGQLPMSIPQSQTDLMMTLQRLISTYGGQ